MLGIAQYVVSYGLHFLREHSVRYHCEFRQEPKEYPLEVGSGFSQYLGVIGGVLYYIVGVADAPAKPDRLVGYQVVVTIDGDECALVVGEGAHVEVVAALADAVPEQPILVEQVGSVSDELVVEVGFVQVCDVPRLYVQLLV